MDTCPKCGFSLAEGAVECPACGVVLAKYLAQTAAAAQRPAAPVPTPPPPVVAADEAEPPTLFRGPVRDLQLTHATLQALNTARPWIRFITIYFYVIMGFMVLGGVGMLFSSALNPKLLPVALVYLLYPAIGLPIVLPLARSANAIRELPRLGASAALEAFTLNQAMFWRRSGILTLVMVVIVGAALLLGLVLGAGAMLTR